MNHLSRVSILGALLGVLGFSACSDNNPGGGGSTGSGVSTANGITENKSLGFNYRDAWGKKITVYGSYSFADKNTKTTSTSQQQDIFQSGSLINNDNTTDQNHSINHRFDFNTLEFKNNMYQVVVSVDGENARTENLLIMKQ